MPVEIGRELGDRPVVRPHHADRRRALRERLGIGEEARAGDDHRDAVRHRRIVGDAHELIFDDPA